MTPRMKKILSELKKLNAYELALLDATSEGVGRAIIAVIRGLDEHLKDTRSGMILGLTIEEFELARTKKIHAIKMVRERVNLGLAETKKMVDEAMNRASLGEIGTKL